MLTQVTQMEFLFADSNNNTTTNPRLWQSEHAKMEHKTIGAPQPDHGPHEAQMQKPRYARADEMITDPRKYT